MKFYLNQHQYYCGIDLHARTMYVCIIDNQGNILVHKNVPVGTDSLLQIISPYLPDIVIGVECIFTWYWIADFCSDNSIPFILGHALYMKAIHGGKSKSDKIDSEKIAGLLRGGMFPVAYVYPGNMRSARDLLRRREYFVRHQAELFTHIKLTNYQYSFAKLENRLRSSSYRDSLPEQFLDASVKISIETDNLLADTFHTALLKIEAEIKKHAKNHDPVSLHLLKSIPGIGDILSLVILYEIQDINRFPSVGNFISYSRLVKCSHESAGKKTKGGHNKIGNSHLKWAFSEAAVLFLRNNEPAKKFHQKLVNKYGKAKALSIIAQKIGRTVFFMLKRKEPFSFNRFFKDGVPEPVV
jgi:transposase